MPRKNAASLENIRARLERNTIPEALTGCHICWLSGPNGYAFITDGVRNRLAHRVVWELTNGAIPQDMYVCHRCDNRACINPDHLFLGTAADNIADAVRKGRMSTKPRRVGAAVQTAKLTATQVLEIFHATESQSAIAARYGIGRDHVWRIKSKQAWRHLHSS